MRPIRPLLVAGTLMLAVGIGTTVALTTRQAPTATAASPAGQPAASPAGAAASDSTTSPTPTTPPPPRKPDGSGEAAKAVATARAFLARELGMTEPVAGPFRSTDARTGQVGFRHKYGEGRRLLPQTGPYAVVVRLQRLPAGWWVLGVNGRSIQITSPTRLQRISSPLAVRAPPRSMRAPCTSRSPRTAPDATCCSARALSTAGPAPSPATSAPSASASRPAPAPAG